MKKRIVALSLVFLLVLSLVPVSALDLSVLPGFGTVFHREDYVLADGLTLSTLSGAGTSSGSQRAQFVTYQPGSDVGLKLSYGKYLYGASTLSSMAKEVEAQGRQVLYGINGGYFSYQTGIPLGAMIMDGVIQTSDAGKNALCIHKNGSITFGVPSVSLTMATPTGTIAVDFLNKWSSQYGIYLLTDQFSSSTKSSSPSVEVVLRVRGTNQFTHNSTVTAVVEKVLTDVTNTTIEEGTMVLSTMAGTAYAEQLKTLTVGAQISVTASLGTGYENVDTAIGGGDFIVANSAAGTLTEDSLLDVKNPLSVVGLLKDGSMIFMQIDGRQTGYSKGMTVKELQSMMLQLGCTYAMNLDGGGPSTSVAALPGNQTASVISSPSNGSEAIISNGILFYNKNAATGVVANYHLYPQNPIMLKNSSLTFTARGTDTTHHAVGLSSYPTLTAPSGSGSFSGYTYQAPAKPGIYTITAKQGNVESKSKVTVTDSVTNITPNITAISMSPGGTATFKLSAWLNNVAAFCSPESFTWKINGDGSSNNTKMLVSNQYGTIDKNGVFTAASSISSGQIIITASYGSTATNITVNIAAAKPPVLLENYNGTLPAVSVSGGASALAYRTSFSKYTDSALQVNYDFTNIPSNGYFSVNSAQTIPIGAIALDIWSSVTSGSAVLKDKNGTVHELVYQKIKTDENGYNLLRATIPANLASPLTLVSPFRFYSNAEPGTVFLDELRAYFGEFSYKDVAADMWAKSYIDDLTYRGIMSGSNENGVLSFRPNDNLKRCEFAIVIANYLNLDVDDYKNTVLPYADAASIPTWALPYVKAVTAEGLFTGGSDTDGKLYFNPMNPIKRVEVMVVLARLLENPSSSTTPPTFTDQADVPAWASDAVKLITSLGIIGGYPDGTLLPNQQMKRSEITKVVALMK